MSHGFTSCTRNLTLLVSCWTSHGLWKLPVTSSWSGYQKTDLDGEAAALALVIEHDGTPIGDVALWLTDKEHRQGEIGWVLNPAHGGQGFASEAVRAVLALGFDHYHLHRITAQMDARNSASVALANHVGLRLEAHHVQDWFSKGEWTDTLIYARLASETISQ